MKEAGYEWNSEKKELKKIEQKPADKLEPMFNVDDIISDGISEVKIVSIDKKNKYYNITNGEIENDAHICNWVIYFKDQEKWKLVKNKDNKKHSQSKQEWSEEDETVLNNLIYALANDRIGNDRDEYVSWLKSLKQRIGG
jgi:ABC-type dipeptide/oligopeptide/nickel transport system ATPase subunit